MKRAALLIALLFGISAAAHEGWPCQFQLSNEGIRREAARGAESEAGRQRRPRGAAEEPAGRDCDYEVGDSARLDPTQVNSLLKSTPSILPRDKRTRFCARIGSRSSSGRRNIIRISIFTPPPSAAWSAGAYSIFS